MFFNLLKNKEDSIKKMALLWHEACMACVPDSEIEWLYHPRPEVASILFFTGAIDCLCQSKKVSDDVFMKTLKSFLKEAGFQEGIYIPVITNFYKDVKRNDFALNMNLIGGKSAGEFFSGKNKMAPMIFCMLLVDWKENLILEPEEIYLFDT